MTLSALVLPLSHILKRGRFYIGGESEPAISRQRTMLITLDDFFIRYILSEKIDNNKYTVIFM